MASPSADARRAGFNAATAPARVRRSITGAASFGISVAVLTGLFAIASVYLARVLPTAEFGQVAFGLNLHLLLLTLAGLGLSSGVMAEVAHGRSAANVSWPNVETLLAIRVASATMLPLAGALWSLVTWNPVPLLASITAGLFITQDFFVGIMAGQLRITAAAIVTSVQPVSYVILLVALDVRSAVEVLLVLAAALALSLVLTLMATSGLKVRMVAWSHVDLRRVVAATGIARYAYIMTFLQIGLFVGPVVVLGAAARFEDAATLSIAMAFIRLVPDVLGIVINAVYFPRITAAGGSGSPPAVALFSMFARLIALVTIPAAIMVAVLGQVVLALLFAGKYDHAGPHIAIGSLLIVLLPIETLLGWTLVASGVGRVALSALTARLAIVLAGTAVFAALGDRAPFDMIMLAYLAGSIVSLAIHVLGAVGRWPMSPRLPALLTYAAMTAAACLGVRLMLTGQDVWPVAAGTLAAVGAMVICVALLVRGLHRIGPGQ